MTALTATERNVLLVGAGLVLLGTAGIGLLEILAGSPHPVSSDGQIVHEALVPLALRSYVILAGFLVWAGFAVYRFLTTTPTVSGGRTI